MSFAAKTRFHPLLWLLGLVLVLAWTQLGPSRGAPVVQLPASKADIQPGSVLPHTYGGVEHFAMPARFNKSEPTIGNGTISGTLHLFLKAARWPDGHLRMKGFAFFESDSWPEHWRETAALRWLGVRNVPEVYHQLRLGLRAGEGPQSGGWERELSLQTAMCPGILSDGQGDNKGFDDCVAHMRERKEAYYDYPDISVDFGKTGSVAYELFLYNTPRYFSLAGLLAHAKPAEVAGSPPAQPSIHKIMPPVVPHGSISSAQGAQRLAWQAEHHAAIGFTSVIMYTYPDQALALASEEVLQPLISSGKVQLVAWDELALWEGVKIYDQQLVFAHGVLSFYGRWTYVFPADLDEFLIPATADAALPAMLTTGCLSQQSECGILPGRAIFPHQADPPTMSEPDLWAQPGPSPLRHYRYASKQGGLPKPVLNPNHVFPAAIHYTNVCTGVGSVADGSSTDKLASPCDQRRPCTAVVESCAWVAHVINMHRVRGPPENATLLQPDWLWMSRSSAHAAVNSG